MFGLRTIVGNRVARVAAAAAEQAQAVGGLDGRAEYEPARQALEEATKRLLVEVGGNREETVMAAAHHQLAAGESSEGNGEDEMVDDVVDVGGDEPATVSPPQTQTQDTPQAQVTMIEANPTTKCGLVGATTASPSDKEKGDVGGTHAEQNTGWRRGSGRGALQVEEVEVEKEGEAETRAFSCSKVDDGVAKQGGGGGGVADSLMPPEEPSSYLSDAIDELVAVRTDAADMHVAEEAEATLPTGKGRRKAVRARRARARRAENKRRRAAELAAQQAGSRRTAGTSSAMKFLQQRWARRWRMLVSARGKGKMGASPQREEVMKLVIALSRPPPGDDYFDDGSGKAE